MEGLPPIDAGHIAYVVTWALLGMVVSAVAWPSRRSSYKDYLTGTLGISFEAVGVEIAARQPALVVPLLSALLIAVTIRYLPDEVHARRRAYARGAVGRRLKRAALVLVFFIAQVAVLLLAYRGWLDHLVLYPAT